mmetsp:Transcript_11667/g.49093  ORF Transcript_11667/g.49093 Transcript_11667/m.49093 type:complete len:262 (+) Transcript_11667:1058-1843(+)
MRTRPTVNVRWRFRSGSRPRRTSSRRLATPLRPAPWPTGTRCKPVSRGAARRPAHTIRASSRRHFAPTPTLVGISCTTMTAESRTLNSALAATHSRPPMMTWRRAMRFRTLKDTTTRDQTRTHPGHRPARRSRTFLSMTSNTMLIGESTLIRRKYRWRMLRAPTMQAPRGRQCKPLRRAARRQRSHGRRARLRWKVGAWTAPCKTEVPTRTLPTLAPAPSSSRTRWDSRPNRATLYMAASGGTAQTPTARACWMRKTATRC